MGRTWPVSLSGAVRLFGETIPVRAEVVTLGGFSAHADQSALTGWLRGFRRKPVRVCLVHGEEDVQRAFAASGDEVVVLSRSGGAPA